MGKLSSLQISQGASRALQLESEFAEHCMRWMHIERSSTLSIQFVKGIILRRNGAYEMFFYAVGIVEFSNILRVERQASSNCPALTA